MSGLLFPQSGSAQGTDFTVELAKASPSPLTTREAPSVERRYCIIVGHGHGEDIGLNPPGTIVKASNPK
jgi:hypothetical protein